MKPLDLMASRGLSAITRLQRVGQVVNHASSEGVIAALQTTLTLVVVLMTGCAGQARPKAHIVSSISNTAPEGGGNSSNVFQFILDEVRAYGGKPTLTNAIPSVDVPWHYDRFQERTLIRLPPDIGQHVQSFLRDTFGPPLENGPPLADAGTGVGRAEQTQQ